MKYYCIEIENCGFFTKTEDEQTLLVTCPACWSSLLAYEDHEVPIFMQENELAVASASHDAGVAEGSHSYENNKAETKE